MNLSRSDRRERLDALAAEYALGTMPARARTRLDRIARTDAVVAQALAGWERRIATLADALPPVQPAPRVWTDLCRRLGLHEGYRGTGWQRLAFWRGLALASLVAAFAFGVTLFAPLTERPAESIVVVLAGADAKPALIASVPRGARTLSVKTIAPVAVPPGRTLELWMLPDQGAPRSLGVIPADGGRHVRLEAPPDLALRGIDALAVSLEPSGGSPTGAPTGPVLYTGRIERL